MAESLVGAAGEGCREFCPCFAEVVRHIGHVGHVGTGVIAQTEGVALLIALEVDNDPESFARSEEELVFQGNIGVIGKPVVVDALK